MWSATNIDVVTIHPGDRVLCLAPTNALTTSQPTAMRAFALVWRAGTAIEAAGACRRGASVTVVSPNRRAVAAMGQT